MTQTFSPQTLSKDIKDFNSLDPQRKLIIAGVVLILFVGSIFVGAYLSKGNKTDTTNPVNQVENNQDRAPEKSPSTALTMMAEKTMKVGGSQVVSVELATVPVTAADVVVTYDPDVFTVSMVENGEVFAKVIQKKIDATEGTITFSGSVDPAQPSDLKEGKVMSFKITAKKESASSLLQFDKNDTITAINGENMLGLTTGATIKVSK